MLVPLSWLRDFTPLEGDVQLISDTFNDLGLVVEGIKHIGEGLGGVVVGRVLDVRPHPNADKVRLTDVDLGDGQPLQIACGADNVATGQLVPVAPVGTVLPGNFEIGRRKLRGEWSNGMICSADELGLATERARGILVLPEHLTPGQRFVEAMNIVPDVVFDLAIETNRPDAMCIAGAARDIAAKLKLPFSIPEPVLREGATKAFDIASVTVDRPDLCHRFTGRVLTGVEVGPSPELVTRRLTMAGMRPINNVVDASNYVMLELGQPSHPYDLDLLPGKGLRVRAARPGETLTTLDDVKRTLTERDCVICDAEDNVVGVAGIMGGASSEIGSGTTNVLLEAAVFDAYAINYTSRRLALRTDASARFERRVDREGVVRAGDRFAELVQQSSPSTVVASGVIDVNHAEPWPSEAERVVVRTSRVNGILGTALDDQTVRDYIAPIGFESTAVAGGGREVLIPSFRPDCEREIDVIEEVARMHGYENIPRRVRTSPSVGGLTPYQRERRRLASLLVGLGFTEAWTATLLSPGEIERAGLPEEGAVELENPIVQEESRLRTSLVPGMLRAIGTNLARRNLGVRLFEIGHTFRPPLDGEVLPDEREMLGVAIADGSSDATAAPALWTAIRDGMRVRGLTVDNTPAPGMHPTRSAVIRTEDGAVVGQFGEIDPEVLSGHAIDRRVVWLELETGPVLGRVDTTPQFRSISRFPAAEFDLAFVLDVATPAASVESTLSTAIGDLCESVELFDVFRGPQVGEGKRSLAYRVRVAALDRTLSEAEVADVRARAIEAVESDHGATLRA